jgi:predicted MPP superfamily phosphohydrolase
MILFLLIFLSVYGGMHLYAFIKLQIILPPRPYLKRLLMAWMIVMTVIPLLVRSAELFGMAKTALVIAWPGYLWMGFLFILFSILLLSDFFRGINRFVLRRIFRNLTEGPGSRQLCRFSLVIAGIASAYAFIEAGQIRSEHIVIPSSKISADTRRIRIVQISDVHIGLLHGENRLRSTCEKVAEAAPDILVSTGDLVDGKLNRDDAISGHNPLAALLATIPAPSGKFAVVGNHEVYAGLPQAVSFTRSAGFTLLRNRSFPLAHGMVVSGIDDMAVIRTKRDAPASETDLLDAAPPEAFHILLKHRPEIPASSDGRFDLQLSGHVHGGQLFPFNFLVRLKYPLPCGKSVTKAGSLLYVSRGTGTWGPPMRLLAPPEITIIDIIPLPSSSRNISR